MCWRRICAVGQWLAFLHAIVTADPECADASEPANGASTLQQPGVVSADFIFDRAPHLECHASTIAETPAGLIAAWFGGTEEKHPDVGIWVSRQVDGRWSVPLEVANGIDSPEVRYPTWNPVLFQPKQGPLLLFYKVGPSPETWWGMMRTSSDHGATWSAARRLPDGFIGPVKNKPLQLDDGTLVCPSSTEHDGWRLHLEFTNDLGKTWRRSADLNDGRSIGAIQPTFLLHPRGRWQMLARDKRRMGMIWTTWSNDRGDTWSPLEATTLPNPSSGIDAVTLSDGRHLLVYNHTQRSSDRSEIDQSRSMLNVAVSSDGEEWQAAILLENSPGEYSYPAVIQTKDGLVHITYTWKRKRIRHVVIDPAKLRLIPIAGGVWPTSIANDN
jgi:predicted neuraminidase